MLGSWASLLAKAAIGRGFGVALALTMAPAISFAQVDSEVLAGRIADSLSTIKDPRYRTAAFSRVRNAGTQVNVNELIDYANVKIVRGRRLRVVDRSKLNLILKEQQIQLSDFVSAKKYKELGKLLGEPGDSRLSVGSWLAVRPRRCDT